MKNLYIVLIIALIAVPLAAEWVQLPISENVELVSYQQETRGDIDLEFNLDGYDVKEIVKSGNTYSWISYPEEGEILEIGMPDLPVFTRLIAIPDQGEVSLQVIAKESHTISDILVYPQEELLTESEPVRETFIRNNEYYQKGGIYPLEIAQVGDPAIMRDLRLVKVSFYPFQYNAAKRELIVHDQISVKLRIDGRGGINAKTQTKAFSRSYESLYKSLVLNYEEVAALRTEYQRPAILIIYPDNNSVENDLGYLIDWKDKKGFDVSTAHTGETGTNTNSIKNYIQDAYDNWSNPPEYVLLVGDANGTIAIPSWTESWSGYGGIGDQPYALLEGNDVLADVVIGRFSVNSQSELQTMIAKSINYEKEPYMTDPQWFERAVLVGDPSHSGPSTISTCLAAKSYIENHNSDFVFHETYNGSWSNGLSAGINLGASYVCYRGYIGMSGWGTTNINSLYNGWMLPFGSILTCGTGGFDGTARSEVFAKAGSPSQPKGAIAAVGTATSGTHTCFNNSVTSGMFYGIFVDNNYTPGEALVRGKLNLYTQYPQNPDSFVNIFSHWNNLMGDPSVELWTAVPQPMTVFYDAELAHGSNYMQVVVLDASGSPLENAWVTARGDDYYQTGFTDINGIYYLDTEEVELGEDYELTITSHDCYPFEEEFTVIQAEVNLDIANINLNDTNGDGIANPGETIEVDLEFFNYGSQTATNVEAELEATSDYTEITNASIALGDIPAGSSVSNDLLAFNIDPATPGSYTVKFNLNLTSDQDNRVVPVFLEIAGSVLNAIEYGIYNSSGVIEPGETEEIYFSVANYGEITAMNVIGELECANSRITILDSLAEFGSIMPDDEVDNYTDRFEITASSAILPGTQVPMTIHFTNADGYDGFSTILLPIGEVNQSDPLGPDEYGYYCYDDGDTDYEKCPDYNWIEINNVGTNTGIYTGGDDADNADVDLPADFTFVFYGQEYDMITVSTAGWIAPGGSEVEAFMNWTVPAPHGPSPMIAAFWDDLHNGSGHVYTHYDASEHIFIVEWDHMQNEMSNQEETFQIILYDPNFYPTTTGDSEIKIQYKVVNNVNSGYYRADHGQYCTVGLEDPSATIGLLYTYNNDYPTAAKTLQDQMAILFTSPPIPPDGPFLTVIDYSAFAGNDSFIEAGEEAVISLTLENIGAEAANDISLTISENDQYITIIDDSHSCDIVLANDMVNITDAFTISISENVPDFYTFSLNVNIASNEDSWNQNIALTAYQANTFAVYPDSIQYEINWGETGSTSFELSNIGDVPVNFYIRTDETTLSRDVTGSFVECDTDGFTPGETTTWTFTVYNASADNEWVSDVWIDFPLGVTVNSASDFVGGSGGNMLWDGTTGQGAYVNWHGITANDWGVLHDGEIASGSVDVTLSTEFAGDMTINYTIGGDGFGADPHLVDGEIILEYPLRWINLNMSSGTISQGDSQEIIINFDTTDIPEEIHNCDIVITSDSWDGKTIPISLIPILNDTDFDHIPAFTGLKQNYPNPFNPVTIIPFSISDKAESVKLQIYNMKGQLINTLYDAPADVGNYNLTWEGIDKQGNCVASGIYFYRLSVDGNAMSRKMILIK